MIAICRFTFACIFTLQKEAIRRGERFCQRETRRWRYAKGSVMTMATQDNRKCRNVGIYVGFEGSDASK